MGRIRADNGGDRLTIDRLHFIAGLPRSGSTLLCNLLGQNPLCHVTPTSGLIELVHGVRSQWRDVQEFQAAGLENIEPRVKTAIAGLLRGFYRDELDAGKAVFDKSRGWPAYIELLEEVLERRVEIVVPVRDIRDVVASFEKLHRKNPLLRREGQGDGYLDMQTVDGRARQLLQPGAVLGLAVRRILDAFDRGLGDRLIIVPYAELTVNPVKVVAWLCWRLGLPPFICDPDNVEQLTTEDDHLHGFRSLHAVHRQVRPDPSGSWAGVLPDHVAKWLNEECSDIQTLARSGLAQPFTQECINGIVDERTGLHSGSETGEPETLGCAERSCRASA